MRDQLISFEVAKLAREKGFDQSTYAYYNPEGRRFGTPTPNLSDPMWLEIFFRDENYYEDQFSAPTQALLQKWLREEHEINVESNYLPNLPGYKCLFVPMTDKISTKEKYALFSKYYGKELHSTYEEALEEGLLNALQLI